MLAIGRAYCLSIGIDLLVHFLGGEPAFGRGNQKDTNHFMGRRKPMIVNHLRGPAICWGCEFFPPCFLGIRLAGADVGASLIRGHMLFDWVLREVKSRRVPFQARVFGCKLHSKMAVFRISNMGNSLATSQTVLNWLNKYNLPRHMDRNKHLCRSSPKRVCVCVCVCVFGWCFKEWGCD